jgi:murein endopeptidase
MSVVATAETPEAEPSDDSHPGRCTPEPLVAPRELDIPPPIELARMIRERPAELGSASIGSPTNGRLWGGVQLRPSEGIEPSGDYLWGTEAVVHSIERAVQQVRRCFADTPKLFVGDISRQYGGWLKPHRSHQAGIDADVGYYYLSGSAWFEAATASTLDRARTWALIRALIDGGNVESMFIDRSVQRLLREYAEHLEEGDAVRLDDMFESAKRRHDVVIHHAPGHTGHFHVRFRDPVAAALGVRVAPMVRPR